MDHARLLEGIQVLDLAGPSLQLAGRLAAELGAEVLHLEPPDGDPARRLGPWAHERRDRDGSLTFAALNSGKRSALLDPASDTAAPILAELAAARDVVLISPDSPFFPLIDTAAIVASGTPVVGLSGFGGDGPYAGYRAPEIVTTALGGLLYMSGDPARPPCSPPEQIGQHFANVWAALALVCAVWAARTAGEIATYRISTHEALATQEHLIRAAAMDGQSITRAGSQHKSVAPATVFPTNDGFVYIYVSRNHWPAFLGAWDTHPADFDEPGLVPNSARRAIAGKLNAAIADWTSKSSSHDLVTLLQRAGVPCLAVNRPSEFMLDDQVVARGLFAEMVDPTMGPFRQIRFPALIDGQRPAATRPPILGEATDLIRGRAEEAVRS